MGRVFVEGAYTPVVSLEIMRSVRFAILNERAKTDEEVVKLMRKRAEANDAASIYLL